MEEDQKRGSNPLSQEKKHVLGKGWPSFLAGCSILIFSIVIRFGPPQFYLEGILVFIADESQSLSFILIIFGIFRILLNLYSKKWRYFEEKKGWSQKNVSMGLGFIAGGFLVFIIINVLGLLIIGDSPDVGRVLP